MILFFYKRLTQNLLFSFLLLLIVSLVIGRAPLSIISVCMILPVFFIKYQKQETRNIIIALCFTIIPVVISFFWSNNKYEWGQSVFTKIPFFTIIISIIHASLNKQQLKQAVWLLSSIIFCGCIWSIGNYVYHFHEINQSYLVAKVMPTLMDNDHIRFSWLIVLNMILLSWQLFNQSTPTEKKIGISLLVFFFIFIHLLAAKTGLLSLYIALFIAIIYFLFFSKDKKYGFGILIALLILSFVSYFIFPTFRNRIQYVRWDFNQYSNGIYLQGSSDGGRVLSIKSGLSLTASNPLWGVGFGDLRGETNDWYAEHFPATKASERFIPQTAFLVYSAASGLIGLLFFLAGIFLLMRVFIFKNLFAICISAVLLLPLFIDDCFEGQFPVVIFSLIFGLSFVQKKLYN
jgi:hypothetical protein